MPKHFRWTLLSGLVLGLQISSIAFANPTYTLEQAVHDALALDPRTSAAQLELDASKTDISIAEGGHYPSFTAQAGSRSFEGILEYNFNVTQKLYDWGRVSSQVDSSIASNNQSAEELRQAISSTAFDIAQIYIDYQQAKDSAAVYRDYLAKLNQFLEIASLRSAKNFTGGEEMERVYLEHARASNLLAGFEGQQQSTRRDFMTVTGKDPDRFTLAPAPEFPLLKHYHDTNSLDKAIEQSPSVKANLAEAEKARAELELTKAQLLPQLNLEVDLRRREFDSRIDNDVIVALRLRSETFSGISNFLKPDAAQNRVESREYQMKAARRDLRRSLQQLASLQPTIKNRMLALESQKKASGRMMTIYQQQFLAGLKDFDDLLLVTRDYFDARRQQIQLRKDLLNNQYEVASSFGVFDQMLAAAVVDMNSYPDTPSNHDATTITAHLKPQMRLQLAPPNLTQTPPDPDAMVALEVEAADALETKQLSSDVVTLSNDAPLESVDDVPINYVEIVPEQQHAEQNTAEPNESDVGLKAKILSIFGGEDGQDSISSKQENIADSVDDSGKEIVATVADDESVQLDTPSINEESSGTTAITPELNDKEQQISKSITVDTSIEDTHPTTSQIEEVAPLKNESSLILADTDETADESVSVPIKNEEKATPDTKPDDVETEQTPKIISVAQQDTTAAAEPSGNIKSKIVFETASSSTPLTRIEYCGQGSCQSLNSISIIRE